MINLLPDDRKKDIRTARSNVILLRYNFILVAVLIAICTIYALLYLGLTRNQSEATTNKGENEKLASAYSKARVESEEYSRNLATARTILDNTIAYTSLISAITESVPSGVVLDTLSLKAESIGQPTVFSARAKSYAKAIELKERFQKSKVFSNVFLQSVQEGSDGGGSSSGYPYSVTISATINRDLKL